MWSAPVPLPAQLEALTKRVAENNRFAAVRASVDNPIIAELRQRIKHVIYVIKENRTYDQVLGDLEVGDGDLPDLPGYDRNLWRNCFSE